MYWIPVRARSGGTVDGRKYRLNVVEFNSLTQVRICFQFTLHIRKLSVRWVTTACCVANFEAGINTLLASLKVGGAKRREGASRNILHSCPKLSCDGLSHGAAGCGSRAKRQRYRFMQTYTQKKKTYKHIDTFKHTHMDA